jgi:hypothetical protein
VGLGVGVGVTVGVVVGDGVVVGEGEGAAVGVRDGVGKGDSPNACSKETGVGLTGGLRWHAAKAVVLTRRITSQAIRRI